MKRSTIALLAGVLLTVIIGGAAVYQFAFKSADNEETVADPSRFAIYLMGDDTQSNGRIPIKLTGSPDLTESAVTQAWAAVGSQNDWSVMVDFNEEGRQRLRDLTTNNIGKRLAMAVNGVIVSTPQIHSTIDGTIEVPGPFSEAEARSLAATILSEG